MFRVRACACVCLCISGRSPTESGVALPEQRYVYANVLPQQAAVPGPRHRHTQGRILCTGAQVPRPCTPYPVPVPHTPSLYPILSSLTSPSLPLYFTTFPFPSVFT